FVPMTFASTLSPTAIRASSATFNGMATPGGLSSVARFQWGTNMSYGQTTAPADVGNGSGVVFVSTNIASLLPFTAYHYRLAVSNAFGNFYGRDQVFTTSGRVTAWGSGSQTNVPSTLHDAVAISGGLGHSLAIQNDGTVVAWGTNIYGQGSVPANITN